MPTVSYRLEPDLSPEEFIDVLVRSTLAERRPVHEQDTMRAMLASAGVKDLDRYAVTPGNRDFLPDFFVD